VRATGGQHGRLGRERQDGALSDPRGDHRERLAVAGQHQRARDRADLEPGSRRDVQIEREVVAAERARGRGDQMDGVRARLAQGERTAAVDSWNRYFQQRGIRTQAPQLVVEALADPRGRPAALAAIDDLPPDEFVFYSSVVLGDANRAARVVQNLERGTDVMDNVIWWELARPLRRTQDFHRLARAVGLEELWRVRGWPDKCRPKGAGDFVCD